MHLMILSCLKTLDYLLMTVELMTIVNQFEEAINLLLDSMREEQKLRIEMAKSLSLIKDANSFIEANDVPRKGTITYTKNSTASRDYERIREKLEELRKDRDAAKNAFRILKDIVASRGFSKLIEERTVKLEKAYDLEFSKHIANQEKAANSLFVKVKINELIYESVQKYNNLISARAAQVNEKTQVVSDELNRMATNALRLTLVKLKRTVPTLDQAIIEHLSSSMLQWILHSSV